jgi:type II secretory pathway predicted ATPase ExeA
MNDYLDHWGLKEGPLGVTNTYRLTVSGSQNPLIFQPECIKLIYLATKGVPREINRICKLALDVTFAMQEQSINLEIIKKIILDIFKQRGINLNL